MTSRSFTIRVPASSANIGPGFDVLGLSLSLYLTLSVSVHDRPGPPPTLVYSGEGADHVPLDQYKNLITRVALYVLRCHSIPSFPPSLSLSIHNAIPFGRGLGSSAAAVIAGILLANELASLHLSPPRILDYALMVERHPDNVTAALVGGFVGAYLREVEEEGRDVESVPLSEVLPEYPPDAGEAWGRNPPVPPLGIGHWVRFGWAEEIKAVAIIPRFELSTAKARQALPSQYSRKDVVSRILSLLACPFFHTNRYSISNESPS
jgi:homoserine kinase